MAKCERCGNTFDVLDARGEYDAKFRSTGLDYDDLYGGVVCANCAIPDTEGNMDHGRAILMMSGDEDYDDDFVEKHL